MRRRFARVSVIYSETFLAEIVEAGDKIFWMQISLGGLFSAMTEI